MRKLIIAIAALTLLVLAGCAKPGPDSIKYEYKNLSQHNEVLMDQGFITLIKSEDHSTNYAWRCELTKGSMIAVYDNFVTEADKQITYNKLTGADFPSDKRNGYHVWQFKADGESEVEFTLTQINVVTDGEIDSAVYSFTVDKKGNVTRNY